MSNETFKAYKHLPVRCIKVTGTLENARAVVALLNETLRDHEIQHGDKFTAEINEDATLTIMKFDGHGLPKKFAEIGDVINLSGEFFRPERITPSDWLRFGWTEVSE